MEMLAVIGSSVSVITGMYRLLVDIAMYFGMFVIVAMALNFQYGNAGIPNFGCAVQVIVGGFTVSAIATRLAFWIVEKAGIELLPYHTPYEWIYNNDFNVNVLTNSFLEEHPLVGVSLLLFSLSLAMVLGALIGWVISVPAIRLRATYLMITLITMADASQLLGRNIPLICGGTQGMHIPNVFAWYPGDRGVITAVVTLAIGLICFFIFRTMLNSPYGRLMRAIRENDVTCNSVGKNVVGIRRNILMFASAITAIPGVLAAYYYSYVVDAMYQRAYWTYWSWLMLILGGPGNNAGTFLGCALVISMRRLIIIYKWLFDKLLFFPIAYFEQILLGLLLIVVMIFRPDGLISEKLLYIPGVNYRRLVSERMKVDWRTAPRMKFAGKRRRFPLRLRGR
jgi:branched-chain amino acid transport system permease protein